MSFSSDIKQELCKDIGRARHCQLAELSGIYQFCKMRGGFLNKKEDQQSIIAMQTENKRAAAKFCFLCKKAFHVSPRIMVRISRNTNNKGTKTEGIRIYSVCIENPVEAARIREALYLGEESVTDGRLVKNNCCKRAFLRGCFLTSGSMSDPQKSYHLEFVCDSDLQAQQIIKILHDFDLDAKMVIRKKYYVVYLKEGENISDFLSLTEAHKCLLDFENTRVLKDMRNMINRQVNCETANLNKTVSAATRQVENIKIIQARMGLENLPANLRQIAYLRLENPDASLEELGKISDPVIGKSGVNHRLRKLGEIAEKLKV